MASKQSSPIKTVVLLVVVIACAGGAYYFATSASNAPMTQAEMTDWFQSGAMGDEQLSLDEVKQRLRHDNPQDMGEGRWRFDMSQVDPDNTLVVEVVVRGGRAISSTVIQE